MPVYGLQDARNQVNQYARTQTRAGRDLTDEEFGQLGQRLGYSGGDISQDVLQRAFGEVGSHFGALPPSAPPAAPSPAPAPGPAPSPAPGPAPQPGVGVSTPVTPSGAVPPLQPGQGTSTPVTPAGQPGGPVRGVDPHGSYAAETALRYVESQLGRALSPAETQEAIRVAGYSGSGSLTGDQVNLVLQELGRRTGAQWVTFQGGPSPIPTIAPMPTPQPGVGISPPVTPPTGGPQLGRGTSNPLTPNVISGGSVHGVDPHGSFSPDQALQYVQGQLGRPLTPAELHDALQIAQYVGTGSLTGDQVNYVLQEMSRRSGAPWITYQGGATPSMPTAPPPAPTPNQPLQPGRGTSVPLVPQTPITPTVPPVFTGNRGPGNPTDAQVQEFLRNNPGDESRIPAAFAPTPTAAAPQPNQPAPTPTPTPAPTVPTPTVPTPTVPTPAVPTPTTPTPTTPPTGQGTGTPTAYAPNIPPNLRELLGGLFTPNAQTPLQAGAQQSLLGMLQEMQGPVTRESAGIAPVADAYERAQQRNYQRQRSALAERAAQEGTLQSGGFNTEAMGLLADAGNQTASFEAGMVRDEILNRRQQLQQAMTLAGQLGDNEAARELQQQMGLLDATLQQQQQQTARELGLSDLALRGELGRGDLGLRGELGRADIGLRGELGRADIGLRGQLGLGDLDLRRQLGLGDLDLRSQLGLGSLDLQRQLGLGDLDLRNRGLDINSLLGQGDLSLRNAALSQQGQLGRSGQMLGLLQSLLSNQQFYDNLGMTSAQWQALMNQNAIQQLLGGMG